MAENQRPGDIDPQYQETTAPQNPPNSVVGPEERTGWLLSSVGTLALVFLIVGAAFTWVLVQRELGKGGRSPDAQTIGTSGSRDQSPGGFNPEPEHGSVGDELKFRGATQSPKVGLGADITQSGEVAGAPAGARVSLTNVVVDRVDGGAFWIRGGDTTVLVVAPGGTPTVKAGQQVNLSGTIEAAGSTKQIRASRIDVK
jgi:hypothetical protein